MQKFYNDTESYMKYISSRLEIFSQMFEIFFKEIMFDSPDIFESEESIRNNSQLFSSYLKGIEYGNDSIKFISSISTIKNAPDNRTSDNPFIVKMNSIKDLLFFLNNNLVYLLDIDFIPFNFTSNKVISKELCSLFKSKQKYLSGNEFNYQEIYNDTKNI